MGGWLLLLLTSLNRFFASNEIKMIVAQVIMQYDMRLEDGHTERYPSFEVDGSVSSTILVPVPLLPTVNRVHGTQVPTLC